MFSKYLIISAVASVALAAPSLKFSGCNLSKARLSGLPTNQTALIAPTSAPSYVAVAIGVQNYTCGTTGTYTNVGAVAELFDASCLYNTALFSSIQDIVYDIWSEAPDTVTAQDVIAEAAKLESSMFGSAADMVLGQHYFVTNPVTGTGLSPKWDFTSSGVTAGKLEAYFVGSKTGDIASPDGSKNIDWLYLTHLMGDLATQAFRVDTVAGQPPSSCTPGSAEITVRYASKYWLYGAAADLS